MPALQTLLTGISFGEPPRWHDGRLWFSDWGAQEVIAVDLDGESEVVARVRRRSRSVSTGCPTGVCSSSRRATDCSCAGSPTARS